MASPLPKPTERITHPSNPCMDERADRDLTAGTRTCGEQRLEGQGCASDRIRMLSGRMRCAALAAILLTAAQILAQEAPPNPPATHQAAAKVPWEISLTVDVYIPPDQDDYASPIITADHGWLHLEARYDYENQRTGSVWLGYNFSAGKKLKLNLTPMIGGVFGRSQGIAPGCEASLGYKRIMLSITAEYVFDTNSSQKSFYYSEPQLTYSLTDWMRVGLAAQHTKALSTGFDIQRGFLVGFSHKHAEFTTYVYNAGFGAPTAVLEVGWSF